MMPPATIKTPMYNPICDRFMATTVQITTETRDRLKYYGIKDETYDSILNKLMDKWDSTAKK
jgi:hypothetical protein